MSDQEQGGKDRATHDMQRVGERFFGLADVHRGERHRPERQEADTHQCTSDHAQSAMHRR